MFVPVDIYVLRKLDILTFLNKGFSTSLDIRDKSNYLFSA